MKKRFAVIGLGLFGRTVIKTLTQLGAEVIAIDKEKEVVENIKDEVLIAVQIDGADRESLEAHDLKNVDAAIVAMGTNFEEALLTVVTLKQIGVPKVVARARTSIRRNILQQVGCDRVVLPEEEVARNVGKELISGLFFDQVEVDKNYSIAQLVAPEELVGQQVIELELRETYHLNIVTIKRKVVRPTLLGKETVEQIISIPKPDDVILKDDILVLFGHDKDLGRFAATFNEKGK